VAGGPLAFHAPLKAGVPAEEKTVVEDQTHKTGRSGPLGFVTLRHEISQADDVVLTKWQDLVYRADPDPPAPRPEAPVAQTDETEARAIEFDSTLLFRNSPLTLNRHRIHYDLDYARDVEGYPGLVIHGPLLAQHLMPMATEVLGNLSWFAFRATAPVVHIERVTLCLRGHSLWVRCRDSWKRPPRCGPSRAVRICGTSKMRNAEL